MKRREFLQLGVAASAGLVVAKSLESKSAFAADAAKITEKNILKEGQAANVQNYFTKPEKHKEWKEKPGHCAKCSFFNTDGSETTFKGKKYAKCQLLGDPSQPQYVAPTSWCSQYNEKQG